MISLNPIPTRNVTFVPAHAKHIVTVLVQPKLPVYHIFQTKNNFFLLAGAITCHVKQHSFFSLIITFFTTSICSTPAVTLVHVFVSVFMVDCPNEITCFNKYHVVNRNRVVLTSRNNQTGVRSKLLLTTQ